MKKILFACGVIIPVLAQAHVTDELHWFKLSGDNQASFSVAVEDFDRRRTNGVWTKIEKSEEWGISKTYSHFIANCKKKILSLDEQRRCGVTHDGQTADKVYKDIQIIADEDMKKNLLNLICK